MRVGLRGPPELLIVEARKFLNLLWPMPKHDVLPDLVLLQDLRWQLAARFGNRPVFEYRPHYQK